MRNLAFVVSLLSASLIANGAVITPAASLETANLQEDYPAMCVDKQGVPHVVYVAWDGKADSLKVARLEGGKLKPIATAAGPGIIHQPAIACDAKGAIWTIWSQINEKTNAWSLYARRVVGGKPEAKTVTVEGQSGSTVFCDAGADAKGRIWITWQSFGKTGADIFAKHYDPSSDKWSDEIQVTRNPAGDWEPRLAFDKTDGAWIAFDSVRSGVYNVYLARVELDGKTVIKKLTNSPRYQGRASIAAGPDGKTLMIAWENGRLNWGGDTRGVAGSTGLNFAKHAQAARFDIATGKITELPGLSISLRMTPKPAARAKPNKAKKPKRKPQGGKVGVLNMPRIMIDGEGQTWVSARRYIGTSWKLALTRYNAKTGLWAAAAPVAKSPFGQDRHCAWARGAKGELYMAWPSDQRKNKHPLTCGVHLAKIDTAMKMAPGKAAVTPKTAAQKEIWGAKTPQRARSDRHVWEVGGKKYKLYWGDFHRHTDMSACRTPDDGCVVDQFKYAYDVGKLDFLGSSDHTDIANMYGPYEWWHNQKLMDVFHAPELFNSFYVYEREQRWPWGHRNVVFIKRGGPMIYIKRALYKNSIWGKKIPPAADGPAEIAPDELWKLLRAWKYDVSIVSHTGATGMGTNWDGYKKIDNAVENLVEIYQGARVSYEGVNTPQPKVGFPKNVKLKADAHGSVKTGRDFGKFNKGVYQNALKNGYKLGIFTSSDHISTNTSFGGVYVEEFTRKAILEAMNARRTIAGTDKVFIEFSCNGHLLGTVFETTDKPKLKIAVAGTATLGQVTIVRNEKDLKTFTPKSKTLDVTFTDDSPVKGENRYYIRVVQTDGNMAWATPVWATFKTK